MKKYARISKQCVACGTCLDVCPKGAITIDRGMTAVVDETLCIGCKRCVAACPASVILVMEDMKEKEAIA